MKTPVRLHKVDTRSTMERWNDFITEHENQIIIIMVMVCIIGALFAGFYFGMSSNFDSQVSQAVI